MSINLSSFENKCLTSPGQGIKEGEGIFGYKKQWSSFNLNNIY
jgi:hypothetical protein